MVHITLYKPHSTTPEEYSDVTQYDLKDGVLTFVFRENTASPVVTKIATSVPFVVHQEVDTMR